MIVLLGKSGYIASEILSSAVKSGKKILPISRSECDYYDASKLAHLLKDTGANFVINAAGYTGKPNVDACEHAKYECLQGNSVLPGIIREVCEDLSLPWGHISSGCIFSGKRTDGTGWREHDEPNFSFSSPPCSFYSGSKALGEEVLHGAIDCFIWRLRIPFNHQVNSRNYLQKLLSYQYLLEAENSVSQLNEFTEMCLKCTNNNVEPGIYNMTNPGAIQTRQVTEWMKMYGFEDRKFEFFQNEGEFMKEAASTPRSNCVLDTTKAFNAGIGMKPVEEAMIESIIKMRKMM